MRLHRLCLGLALAAAVGALANCGARTGLIAAEVCPMNGATRPCSGVCGAGLQTCEQGLWQACVIPEANRECTNVCGVGTQRCVAEAWQNCEVPPTLLACSTICGAGNQPCVENTLGACDAPKPHDPILNATFFDFHGTQPDFEGTGISPRFVSNPPPDVGILKPELDANNLPVYAGDPTTLTTTGAKDFDVWFRPTPGVNEGVSQNLTLTPVTNQPGFVSYENLAFFPLDNEGFGNETGFHNFDFTMHAESSFIYKGGETFAIGSDDDSWLFINRRLAVDLGGLHNTKRGTVTLDARASELGLVVGMEYPLDVFYAERHVTGATFSLTCTVAPRHQCD